MTENYVLYLDECGDQNLSSFIIVCCAILKEPYIRQYGKLNDVYGLSLSYIMERVVFYLDSLGHDGIELRTVIERRGKKEDKSLLNYYNQLLDRGTYWVNGDRMRNYFKRFDMRWKSENVIGLQVFFHICKFLIVLLCILEKFNIFLT